jgi:3-keto-L-gulonate-6-phosphate decarboxylase
LRKPLGGGADWATCPAALTANTEAAAALSATTLKLESIVNLPGSCVFGRL